MCICFKDFFFHLSIGGRRPAFKFIILKSNSALTEARDADKKERERGEREREREKREREEWVGWWGIM